MKTMRFIPLVALMIAISPPVFAAASQVELKSVAEREVTSVKDGKKQVTRSLVDRALPGDEIVYSTTFKNAGNKPASDIVITNPVPNASTYVSGSAIGANTVITFSADGGKTFVEADKLQVHTAGGKTRHAVPSDYTHIRWTYKGTLGAGKSGVVSFRAVIK